MIMAEEHTAVDVITTIAAPVLDEHEGMDEAALKEHEEVTKIKNVNTLELGKYQMDTWYFSPLPKELLKDGSSGGVIDVLYVDEFSMNFFTRKEELLRYQRKTFASGKKGMTGRRHPPGNEIYRCGDLSSELVHDLSEFLLLLSYTLLVDHSNDSV
jgi:histone acetyltransferase MYST1